MSLESSRSLDGVRWSAPARVRSVQVGAIRATYVPDGRVELHAQSWFRLEPSAAERVYAGREPLLAGDYLTGSLGALLLEGPGWRVLVDAGLGPTRVRRDATHPSLGAMEGGRLSVHSRLVGSVDAVLFTHLHDDHVGWARRGWPGIPEMIHTPHFAGAAELPVPWASRMEPLADGDEVFPGLVALASPGHTHGHMSFMASSGDERLLVFGDVMHSPVQTAFPHLGSCFDVDPALSRRSRAETLALLGAPGTIGVGMHFGDVPFGVLVGGEWTPAD